MKIHSIDIAFYFLKIIVKKKNDQRLLINFSTI